MIVVKTISDLKSIIDDEKSKGITIGFCPTMGYLHDGHVSLIKESQLKTDFTVVSIYVNPSQFNDLTDYELYPRDLEKDQAILDNCNCDLLFLPNVDEIESIPIDLKYDLEGLDIVMEGKYRPGHFDGVAEVVYRLFRAVNPDYAFFGEKDFQQLRIIQKLVEQTLMSISIVPCPIKREHNGLAMSSRNARLSSEYINASKELYQALKLIEQDGKAHLIKSIEKSKEHLIAKGFNVEYVEVVDEKTLKSVHQIQGNSRAFIAAYLGDVRLIDNIPL